MFQGNENVNNEKMMPMLYTQEDSSSTKQNSIVGVGRNESAMSYMKATNAIAPVPYVNVVNANTGGVRKYNAQSITFYCTHCNNTSHTVNRCYRRHGFPPNHKLERKSTAGFGNVCSYASNNTVPFATSLCSLNGDHGFVPHTSVHSSHGNPSSSMHMTMGIGRITSGLSSEQYDKLIFLLNNTQLQGNAKTTNHSELRARGGIVQYIVN